MGTLDGKVALITGAARGQGRSHAQLLAEEGADIIGIDLCQQLDTVNYPMSTDRDLAETAALVEKTGQRMIALVGDVRDYDALQGLVNDAVADLGRLDIVLANAGVMAQALPPLDPVQSRRAWQDSIDTMLTGVWNTLQTTVPILLEQDQGGAIVITSSAAGIRTQPTDRGGGTDGYYAAKFGVVGLMKAYANALGQHNIRVNTVHPTGVATPMIMNDFFPAFLDANPRIAAAFQNSLPIPAIEPIDVSRAILYLVGEDGRFVTGTCHVIDAGITAFK
ncbi:mycofactocin-coupled SDR family oxidoreductase [Mycolicibacterium sp. XJ1819]